MAARPHAPLASRLQRFRCPNCGYDVRQTLADKFERCPECGAGITWDTCSGEYWFDHHVSRLAWVLWLGPSVGITATALLASDLVPWAVSASLLLIFAGMFWIEAHLGANAIVRALGMTLAMALLVGWTCIALLMVIQVLAQLA